MASGQSGHFAGMDDAADWQRSGYAGQRLDRVEQLPARGCRDCHMPVEAHGVGRSHRFVGGHTWLAAARGDAQQLSRTQARLRAALALDVVVVDAAGLPLEEGAQTAFAVDVLLTNVGAGHRFPGGTRDAHATWVQVQQYRGERLVAQTDRTGQTHVLRALLVDAVGKPAAARAVEQFAAVAYDHTIAAGDTRAVRFVLLPVPTTRVVVRVWHQSRPHALQQRACQQRQQQDSFDPCAAQPMTLLAQQLIPLVSAPASATTLLRLGRGLQHALGSELGQARSVLMLGLARSVGADERAALQLELAKVAVAQGRGAEAERWLAEVAKNGDEQAAVSWWHARHLQATWRHQAAVQPLRTLWRSDRRDVRVARRLAATLGVLGAEREALEVVAAGLSRQPRDAALLRLQWQAYGALRRPAVAARMVSHWAYLLHQPRPDAAWLAARCGAWDVDCARERVPGHQHRLVAVSGARATAVSRPGGAR
ncbi:MAG TPA: hypothetical protein ENK23_05020 [Sorangium sp.]|nr:hypothetical protein [Sorangium sp.]